MTVRGATAAPSSIAATRTSVPSQGMRGWFHCTHARCPPPGDGAGEA
ncbi:hypothetical protein LUW76_40345 [Actinomadura madurae]|nr:hypothetical protein [Actinomadura madurae]URN00065.1 hypothetical protein LUW76_40345 [Actinomadura madurae]